MKSGNWRRLRLMASLVFLTGCAGQQRSCTQYEAETYGGNWLVTQANNNGVYLCWIVKDESLTNEQASDGVQWIDQNTGQLIRISGWYNVVQVSGGDAGFQQAAASLGIDISKCNDGKYPDQ